MDIELIQLIVAYTLVGVFVFSAVVTSLSLIGIIKFAHEKQQKMLFKALIIEVVIAAVGFFGNILIFDPGKVRKDIVKNEFKSRKLAFEEKLSFAQKQFESGNLNGAYLIVSNLFKSDELEEYFPIKDLFILNGDIAKEREFWVEAIESYGPALKLDPNNISVIVNAGYVQRRLQNYEKAEELYERALSAEGQNWEILNGYCNCLRRYAAFLSDEYPKIADIKFQKAAEIVKHMRNVSENEREEVLSAIAKGTLYWEWKKYDIALVTYRYLIKKYPKKKRFKEDLAAILMEMSRYIEAKNIFGELYQHEKSGEGVSWYVGSGYAEATAKAISTKQELQEALNAGLIAISNKPDEPFSYYAVALAYKKMDDMEKAIEYISQAESLESNRETNMHTYDKKRHLLYIKLRKKWQANNIE
jgi:tetratricopeptide (TPR) repeat protein